MRGKGGMGEEVGAVNREMGGFSEVGSKIEMGRDLFSSFPSLFSSNKIPSPRLKYYNHFCIFSCEKD